MLCRACARKWPFHGELTAKDTGIGGHATSLELAIKVGDDPSSDKSAVRRRASKAEYILGGKSIICRTDNFGDRRDAHDIVGVTSHMDDQIHRASDEVA